MEFEEILHGAIAGDQAAIDLLARWLRRLLVRSFSRHFGRVNGEDLAHETIADVLAGLHRAPRDPIEFRRWVHGVGRNERREWLAAERRVLDRSSQHTNHTQILPAPPGIDALFATEEKRRLFMKLINELPMQQRRVYLARLEGDSFAEIAAALGILEITARTCASRGRSRVAARWGIERHTASPFRTPPKRNVS